MCKVNLNKELNGIELAFDSKPERATLDAIKAQGFKWNGRKMVWYAKQTADRLTFAQTLGQIETAPKATASINLDNLGENTPHLYGAELAAAIREDLKKRGAKGCTVRTSRGSGLTVTVKASAEDFASLEEYAERYSFGEFSADVQMHGRYIGGGFNGWLYANEYEKMSEEEQERAYYNFMSYEIAHRRDYNIYHRERANYPQFSTAFCEKLDAVFKIANQWNYDNSDIMTDYFDVGYYLDIKIKADEIEPRATMTDAEREAFAEEQRKEEEDRTRQAAEWEKQREAEREAAAKYKAWEDEAVENIYNNVVVEDLDESEQIYINNLVGGFGKESSREELTESITERITPAALDCVVDRLITFTDARAFEDFNKLYLYDFIFLYGKGGTASEDVRLSEDINIYNLTEDQRESVKFYNCHCVGVIYNGKIELVIDPQGYNYARYVYTLTEDSDQKPAADILKEQEQDSALKDAFYFPAPVEEQAAQLHEGQEITIYQCDGWILNSINAGSGIVTGFYAGEYAQYKGLWITLLNGRKERRVFIHNGRKCLIYEGIKPALPEEVTRRKVSANMYEMFNADVLLPNTYNYYKSQGITPIIDTCAR